MDQREVDPPRIAMAQNAFEQNTRTVTVLGVHEDCLYGTISSVDKTTMSDEDPQAKETLEEFLIRMAVDKNGMQLILSIKRTIKSEN